MTQAIFRGTTPTFKLVIDDTVPEGAEFDVTVTQGQSSFSPEVEYDSETQTVSFTLPAASTSVLTPGVPLYVQQTVNVPGAGSTTLAAHEVEVLETLYSEEPEPEEPETNLYRILTQDTAVDPEKVYFKDVYFVVDPVPDVSPLDMGLLESDDGAYIPTQDRVFVEGKAYYDMTIGQVAPENGDDPSANGWYELVTSDEQREMMQEAPEEEDEAQYVPVEPDGTENPSELGWVVLNDMGYFEETTDTTVDQGIAYYEAVQDHDMDNIDEFYEDFDEEEYASVNGLTCVDDEVLPEYDDGYYRHVDPSEGDNPNELGWYELSGTDSYSLTQDTTVVTVSGYERVYPEGTEDPSSLGWYVKNGSDSYSQSADTEVDRTKMYYKTATVPKGYFEKVEYDEWTVDDDSTGGLIPDGEDLVDETVEEGEQGSSQEDDTEGE